MQEMNIKVSTDEPGIVRVELIRASDGEVMNTTRMAATGALELATLLVKYAGRAME